MQCEVFWGSLQQRFDLGAFLRRLFFTSIENGSALLLETRVQWSVLCGESLRRLEEVLGMLGSIRGNIPLRSSVIFKT